MLIAVIVSYYCLSCFFYLVKFFLTTASRHNDFKSAFVVSLFKQFRPNFVSDIVFNSVLGFIYLSD